MSNRAPLAPLPPLPAPAAARSRTVRRSAYALGCLVGLPLLAALVFTHGGAVAPPRSLAVTLAGPTSVATASGVSCTTTDAGVVVRGTLIAAAPAPRGMTLYGSLHPAAGGVSVGLSATLSIPRTATGQSRRFRGTITDTGVVPASDRCVILWVADPAPS
jgi:hypothetical protein